MRNFICCLSGVLFVSGTLVHADPANSYAQFNLVSDLAGVAAHEDPNLVNPWGIAASATSPFWINDNGTGLSTLYNGSGNIVPLVVTIPAPTGSSGPSAPTGMVANSGSSFGGSHFIFDTEDGTISSWTSGTLAVLKVTSPAGSVYKGLAEGASNGSNLLYATNFGLGRVDVFDSSFNATSVSGGFHDPNLPAGYAPFNIENIGGKLYVTYAQQDSEHHDDVSGAGHGFVDVFDTNGSLLQRLVTQGNLNSPWGLALAPSSFGAFSNDLLIGNFGDGTINAYDPATGAFLGTLENSDGTPITIQGLWGLDFGNGAQGQGLDSLFFTAGIPGPDDVEDHGLYGAINATPEPQSVALLLTGLVPLGVSAFRRRIFRNTK